MSALDDETGCRAPRLEHGDDFAPLARRLAARLQARLERAQVPCRRARGVARRAANRQLELRETRPYKGPGGMGSLYATEVGRGTGGLRGFAVTTGQACV